MSSSNKFIQDFKVKYPEFQPYDGLEKFTFQTIKDLGDLIATNQASLEHIAADFKDQGIPYMCSALLFEFAREYPQKLDGTLFKLEKSVQGFSQENTSNMMTAAQIAAKKALWDTDIVNL